MIHIERDGHRLDSLRNPSPEVLDLLEANNPGVVFTFVCYDCSYMYKGKSSLEIWTRSRRHQCADEDAPIITDYDGCQEECPTCNDAVYYCLCNGKKGKSA